MIEIDDYDIENERYKRSRKTFLINFEIIVKSRDDRCRHSTATYESHKFDDKGAWFQCNKCGMFAYCTFEK